MEVNWELYKDCPGTAPDSDHTCPLVVYDNEHGRCYHNACEGPQTECGEIVAVTWP